MTHSIFSSEEEEYASQQGHLCELWDRYWATNDPQDLRGFLEAGGDGAGLEKFMIETIKSGKVKKSRSGRHRSDPYRDIQTFLAAERYRNVEEKKTEIRPNKEVAISSVSERIGIKEATVINQYNRGRDLLFSGKGKRSKTELGNYFIP